MPTLEAILAAAGASPNEGFGIQQPAGPGPLGMSPEAQAMGAQLNAAQQAGQAPPVPADTGGGGAGEIIMALISALAGSKPHDPPQPKAPAQPQQGPQSPAQDLRGLVTPSPASANSPEAMMLLDALMRGG